jgi:NADH:ubiquinone oxidoreductase subunit F (NADH-binding)/NADH:ubiquinone oxidoreductase subunit E
MIVQELLRLQDTYGYLPRKQMAMLANRLSVPLYRVHEVATFFPHFTVFASDDEERRGAAALPEFEVAVCRDMACQLRGSAQYVEALEKAAAAHGSKVRVRTVSCLGRCDRAPAVRIAQHAADSAHSSAAPHPAAPHPAAPHPAVSSSAASEHGSSAHSPSAHGHQVRALMGRPIAEVVAVAQAVFAGRADNNLPDDRDEAFPPSQDPSQWRIDVYGGQPRESRYASIRKFVDSGKSDPSFNTERGRIIKALQTANLLGMGGAGGRAYKKWSEVREAAGERRYVACNGDESEPGTFKDRELLLRSPHLVVEGILLAALVTGAEKAFLYIRHEYEEAIEAARREIAWARERGLCGENILNSGLRCDLQVFVSPGGYICGEQTAMVQAIQDERAEPRNRPPELQTNGLWNMPTLVNNVETLAWAPAIAIAGDGSGRWYADHGRTGYQGARFFSISGDVEKPGVYEVPIGMTLGELLDNHCGGIKGGKPIKAFALSGPSGGFLPPVLPLDSFSADTRDKLKRIVGDDATAFDLRKLPLDMGVTRQLKLMLGAAIIVYAEGADLVAQMLACQRFYKAESCGKCVPCRIGSAKLVAIGEDLQSGKLGQADADRLGDRQQSELFALAQAMADTAICGLGTSAPNPLKSLLAYFPQEVSKYLRT